MMECDCLILPSISPLLNHINNELIHKQASSKAAAALCWWLMVLHLQSDLQ